MIKKEIVMSQCTDVDDDAICTGHPETCTCDYHCR